MEEAGRLQSMASLRVGHDWATSLSLFTFMHWKRKWQPAPVFLPGESQGRRSLLGCCLWGHTRVGLDWRDLALAFFGIGMKTDIFQSFGHCWVFQNCWHIEGSTLMASSFRTWNSSTGIPSPPLALFLVVLPKAHLISDSRISGST